MKAGKNWWRNSAMNGSLQLHEYPAEMVRIPCGKCGRPGQYRKQTLIDRFGPDIRLPDLRAGVRVPRTLSIPFVASGNEIWPAQSISTVQNGTVARQAWKGALG